MGKNLKGKELGEGITQRADGRYMVRYKGVCRYFPNAGSIRELKAERAKLIQEVEEGEQRHPENENIVDYAEKWLRGRLERGEIKESTGINYKQFIKNVVKRYLKGRKVRDINRQSVRALQGELRERLKASTVNRYIGMLECILGQAVEDHILKENPAAVKPCKESEEVKPARETIHRALTEEEEQQLRAAIAGEWFENMILLLLASGMRTGEIRALRWCNIDSRAGVIHITENMTKGIDLKDKRGTPKTKNSKRDIPINGTMREIIQNQKRQTLGFFGAIDLQGYVFRSMNGSPAGVNAAATAIKTAVRRANRSGADMERITPHALRATFATRAIEAGMKPNTLKEILGHSSITITMDLYAHVLPEAKRKEMELLEDWEKSEEERAKDKKNRIDTHFDTLFDTPNGGKRENEGSQEGQRVRALRA